MLGMLFTEGIERLEQYLVMPLILATVVGLELGKLWLMLDISRTNIVLQLLVGVRLQLLVVGL